MRVFTRLDSAILPMRRPNVDTDQITPARFLQKPRSNNFGEYLFRDLRFDNNGAQITAFALNQPVYRAAQVLIAQDNFGCGSSREHAVWALCDYGIRAVVAPRFGDIFFTNALKNGLLPIVLSEEIVEDLLDAAISSPGARVVIDLEDLTLSGPDGEAHQFNIDPRSRHCLLQGIDEIDYTLTQLDLIAAFEQRHSKESVYPMRPAKLSTSGTPTLKIAILPGDGIGREVTEQAVKALRAVIGSSMRMELTEAPIGAAGIDAAGDPLPAATLEIARKADAILFGAAGMPGDEAIPYAMRPGASLLRLRKELGLFANFRPAFLFSELVGASTLKREIVEGLDLLILRELSSDVYFGEPRGIRITSTGEREGFNTMRYSESEVERIGHMAFRTARTRRSKVCSVEKANVLETSQLWREVMTRVGKSYPDVELTHVFVDAAAMMLLRAPKQFDVIVTGNIFGDILSDAAAMLTGSIGMLPSASLASDGKGLYEPVHGTAPDIAGSDIANPIAAILSMGMMLRHSFAQSHNADRVEAAVRKVLANGYRTEDIFQPGTQRVGTAEMGDAIASAIEQEK